jgi:hypothetical protein
MKICHHWRKSCWTERKEILQQYYPPTTEGEEEGMMGRYHAAPLKDIPGMPCPPHPYALYP